MNDLFESLPFRPADILLPKDCEYSKWSVVACDQYTSQPEYWQRVEEYVGTAPSTLLAAALGRSAYVRREFPRL